MSEQGHWASRQPAKQDEVQNLVTRGVDWILTRRRQSATAAGGILLVLAGIGFVLYSRSLRENAAWETLSMAEAYAYYGKGAEAQAELQKLANEGANPTAAGLGAMLEGQLHQAQGRHQEAVSAFDRAAQASPEPLRPFALAERVYSLQLAGQPAECAAAASSFLDALADHFLAPPVHERLAECQLAAGQPEAAKASWQKISLQYPDTPWAARANARLQPTAK